MSSFIAFHIYLILLVSSMIITLVSLIRHNFESVPAQVVIFFLSIIGLACNFAGWVREFSGLYGIVWSG